MVIINVDIHKTDQLWITYSAFVKYLGKNGNTMKQCISYTQTSRKPVIQSEGRSCIKLSSSLVHKTSMANKNVSK